MSGSGGDVLDPSRAPQFLDMMMRRNKIVVISATYCDFCRKLKVLLIEMKHRFVSLEIDIIPNGRELFTEVVARTGVHVVPQVFVGGKYAGGYAELVGLYKTGKLESVLEGA
jgi:glutaredoxin 3